MPGMLHRRSKIISKPLIQTFELLVDPFLDT